MAVKLILAAQDRSRAVNRAATGLLPLGGQLTLTGLSNADADRLRSAGLHDAIRLTPALVR